MRAEVNFLLISLLILSLANGVFAAENNRPQLISVAERDVIKEQITAEVRENLEERREEIVDLVEKRLQERIEIENEGGERVRLRMINRNGDLVQIRIEEEIEGDNIRRLIKYKMKNGEDIEVKTILRVNEKEGNDPKAKLRVELTDGGEKDIILPEKAQEIAKRRIKSKRLDFEIKERIHKNVPRVIYHVRAKKQGRFLGIFKMDMDIESEIDAENEEILSYKKPWWAFLVAGEEDPDDNLEEEI